MAAIVSPLFADDPAPPKGIITPPPALTVAGGPVEEVSGPVAEAAARRAALARLRSGRIGTIATSARGILQPGHASVTRRSLLGG